MKTFSLVLLSLLIGLSISDRSLAEVYTTGSAADNNGNIIVIGYCLGNVRIMGQEYSIPTPSTFMIKLNSDGDLLWIKILSSSQSCKINAVATDSFGNFYLTGEFSGTINLGNSVLTAQNADLIIVKCESSGDVIWAKKSIGAGLEAGNDIALFNDQIILVCGNGNSFTYDNLSVGSGGFTLKIDSEGNGLILIQTHDKAYSISVDSNDSFVIAGNRYHNQPPFLTESSGISKYDINGTHIWSRGGFIGGYTCATVDNNSNVYTADSYFNLSVGQLFRLNPAGVSQSSVQLTNCFINELNAGENDNIVITGLFNNNCNFNDTTLYSAGLQDAVIASVDTGFNIMWIKTGGGLFNDKFEEVTALSDGSILASAYFRGTVNFDNVQVSGGTANDDQWSALLKFSSDGQLLWFKKIGENYIETSSQIWFPTNIGNKWQYFCYSRYYPISHNYSLVTTQITDSVIIDSKKYFRIFNFLNFPDSTLIRYDLQTQRLLIYSSGTENTFIDFSKILGETYLQIQPDGSFNSVTANEESMVVLGDTIPTKGFTRTTGNVWGHYSFAENLGWVIQDEESNTIFTDFYDYTVLECLLYTPDYLHIKHEFVPSINFEPIMFVPDTNRLIQTFEIDHIYSVKSITNYYISGVSYINKAYLQSFYFNGTDTIWNNNFNIPDSSEIDFTLNYQFDTTKYQQGYHLYYRIAAVDKGIVPDTFYSPIDGYYKLFWKDSTTSVTQLSPLVYDYSLSQNFPNPFNPSSKIVFTIPDRNFVSLKVFDVLGSEISSLVNEELDAGRYEVEFFGDDLSSGVYIYQIRAGSFIDTKKMILLR